MPHLTVLFARIGPYHRARLSAAGSKGALTAVELSSVDNTYAWDALPPPNEYSQRTLFTHQDSEDLPPLVVQRAVARLLNDISPDVVAVPGWPSAGALAAISWCNLHRKPVVLMSASQFRDATRWRATEYIKRRIVRQCSAALTGGSNQSDYIYRLGLPSECIFEGYDVVDNQHFADGANSARSDARQLRSRLGLPEKYFLAVSRFVAKKNVNQLLRAYAKYRDNVSAPWQLVLVGDGPLRPQVLGEISRLGLSDNVVLPGFIQYPQLPLCYGLARAFVHASSAEQWGLVVNEAMASGLPVIVSDRCGCATDLVQDGRNGFTFDPGNVEQLAHLLTRTDSNEANLEAMGRASQDIINLWGPDRFANGLWNAVEAAMRRQLPRMRLVDRAILQLAISRPRRKSAAIA